MELEAKHYIRYDFSEPALETWRRHACLPRLSSAQREASYAAAVPLFELAADSLVQLHAWRHIAPPSDIALFSIQPPSTDTVDAIFTLPRTFRALLAHAQPCARMFEAVFAVRDVAPLADVFHLLQLLAPGCVALVAAEHASHELDNDGEVAWITWRTRVRALPPPAWMDLHAVQSPQLVSVFGETRWAALRRAATDSEVMSGSDVTFG